MQKIKVLTIFGTRPEAIKMIPIIKEMQNNDNIISEVCVTAQHRQMLDQVLSIFNIKPEYDLNIMTENQTLTKITTEVLLGLEQILKKSKPDLILVHGDTTTTFVGALAAFYHKIKIGHVEAGLRTYNKYEPFPEELNRKLTGAICDIHFAPTIYSKQNLLKENINEKDIFVTGNTVIDIIKTTVEKDYIFNFEKLNKIDYTKKIITITAHRRENFGKPLENICSAILDIVNNNENVEVVYSVHYNPLVRDTVHKMLRDNKKIHLTDPLDIKDMHNLINKSYFVMTDSGGLQEEVPSFKKPVLVLRNVTERQEGLKANVLKLVGTERLDIINAVNMLIKDNKEYAKMTNTNNPFGDGLASKRVINAVLYHFKIIKDKPKDFEIKL